MILVGIVLCFKIMLENFLLNANIASMVGILIFS
jgi:hypothetical protein